MRTSRVNAKYEGRTVAVTALMVNKAEEAKLLNGDSVISFASSSYTHGIGLLLNDCRLAKDT